MLLKDIEAYAKNRAKESMLPLGEYMILIEETLKLTRQDFFLNPHKEFCEQTIQLLNSRFDELEANRPLQYILGYWEFMGINYSVGEGVLIPREDTMAAVELALEFLKDKDEKTFIDLGSGSGCIAVTLSKQLNCKGYAVEFSEKAYGYLEKNISNNMAEVTAILGDMFDINTKQKLPKADLIISNPPYITKEDMQRLDDNVKREPATALYGGTDGLEYYRKIAKDYKDKLKDGGAIVFELGYNQMDNVIEILEQNGFCNIKEKKDINAVRRAVLAVKNN